MSLNNYTIKQFVSKLQKVPLFEKTSPALLLKSIEFFKELDPLYLNEISEKIIISEYKKDTIICRHGKFDEYFYIILDGSVKAVIPTEDNPKFELYKLKEKDFFGEEIVFSVTPRENTIIADSNLFLISLDNVLLKELMNKCSHIKSLIDQKYIERKLRRDLRTVPIFTHLEDKHFQDLLNEVELISIPPNEIVLNEGEKGSAFYLIRSGEVNVFKSTKNKKQLIAILSEGQFFGEMSLLSEQKTNASIETTKSSNLVKLSRDNFLEIVSKDKDLMNRFDLIVKERMQNQNDVLHNPNAAIITRKLLDLNNEVNKHLDIVLQCTVETPIGVALLASHPESRYPYVYPRDSACASRMLYKIITSKIKSADIAYRYLSEIARFIMNCQRKDGYWGQRYGFDGVDKGIYKQEDNVAHGAVILCRYLLAAKKRNVEVVNFNKVVNAIKLASSFALKNFYRNEIHLFFSTTSIHESAIEEGYSLWVNFAYLLMFQLIERVACEYNIDLKFTEEIEMKSGFQSTIENVFLLSNRYVRRLRPDGEVDLRPDITLLSPFFFGTGMDIQYFENSEYFENSIKYMIDSLWDPDLGMLQRYLPFIEDPDTHIHAGNGPWIQYTAMLAQYYFFLGKIEKGNEIIQIINKYRSKEKYLCEHLTTPERYHEFNKLEWLTGSDVGKEFTTSILIPGLPYDYLVEELNHMKKSYVEVASQCKPENKNKYITFATPLMWSHAEYAMALMFRTEKEILKLENNS